MRPLQSQTVKAAPLPFTAPLEEQKEAFDSILIRRYLRPAIQWLLGQDPNQSADIADQERAIAAQLMNCWWGLGLCVEAFVRLQAASEFNGNERRVLLTRAIQFARELMAHQNQDSSWDKVTWDTSVICRALLVLAGFARTSAGSFEGANELINLIEGRVRSALRWVIGQALQKDNVRYAFGPEDLGQVVRLLCAAEQYGHGVFPNDYEKLGVRVPRDLATQLVGYLVDERTESVSGTGAVQFKPWEAPFAAAHMLLAFSEAFPILPEDTRARVVTCMVATIEIAERTQDAGRWGLPNETALMLEGYLEACLVLQAWDRTFSPKPEVVFRALRWLSDEKQRFGDGSILHMFDCTCFFVLSLQTIVTRKVDVGLLNLTVPQLYDFILWNEQMGSSRERAERLRLMEEYYYEKQRRAAVSRSANTYASVVRILGVAGILLTFLAVSIITGWDTRFSTDPSFTIAYATAAASAVSVFLVVTRRMIRDGER